MLQKENPHKLMQGFPNQKKTKLKLKQQPLQMQ